MRWCRRIRPLSTRCLRYNACLDLGLSWDKSAPFYIKSNFMSAHILVVDDEVDFCSNMADILGDMGYEIDVAHRGAEAIEKATQQPYDLFLLDYKLPCMTGS
jgi:PleD family two-component response regulator